MKKNAKITQMTIVFSDGDAAATVIVTPEAHAKLRCEVWQMGKCLVASSYESSNGCSRAASKAFRRAVDLGVFKEDADEDAEGQ